MSETQSPSTQSLVTLTLVDTEELLIRAWRQEFAAFPEVSIAEGDILGLATNCVVSPANSYGYMDGGIDREYVDFFGSKLQMVVQDAIAKRPEGYLPVGAAIVISTGNPRIPHMICAPTMVLPQAVPSINSYWAMVAVLRTASARPELAKNVFCPGLATGVGQVDPSAAAREMRAAYADWLERKTARP